MARQPDKGIYENFLRRDGRLNRLRYFKRIVLIGIIDAIIGAVIGAVASDDFGQLSTMGDILDKIFAILFLIPQFCLMIRRLHDMNKGNTLAYVNVILGVVSLFLVEHMVASISSGEPLMVESTIAGVFLIAQVVISLYILFCPGTKGDNNYGSDPLEREPV